MEDPSKLATIKGPRERAIAAHALIDDYQSAIGELSRLRREALEELLSSGMSQSQIADMLDMSRSRVSQLLSAGIRPERAFLGTGGLTVALGGKHEAGKEKPGAVVSAEALAAYDRLAELARSLGLKAEYEVVPPPGFVTLNRSNLIVACGPRLSPLVQQILESDSNIGFAKDSEGWHLIERHTGTVHRSPCDSGKNADVAYLGRLPRPDGKGTFLYMAGIHAIGTAGAAHYIENNLAELYREMKTRRFSVIVTCEFDAESRQVTSSARASQIYRHDGAAQ
ncbi:sigma factor-like helix-turn-helix DNA-binding protein [Actinoplanes sp. NPDC051346]|uniref:sigma factor-like helix-turn-helix DNA-binding protein n=1 Tax=Actinoplanes sp. NPDC051346 TaxID=3155048 RepID=UPI0034287D51